MSNPSRKSVVAALLHCSDRDAIANPYFKLHKFVFTLLLFDFLMFICLK